MEEMLMKEQKKSPVPVVKHVVFRGNVTIVKATREAIGAMKYKAE